MRGDISRTKAFTTLTQNRSEFGGNPNVTVHPSHIMLGHRYMVTAVRTSRHGRQNGMLVCDVETSFGGHYSSQFDSMGWEVSCDPDNGTASDNLDNLEIKAITRFLRYVRKEVIPRHNRTIQSRLYTNAQDFETLAFRFKLIVLTSLNPAVLDFLLVAHELRYNQNQQAYVDRMIGITTRSYRCGPRRRELVEDFMRNLMLLADLGIEVYWRLCKPTQETIDSKRQFMETKSTLRDAFGHEPKNSVSDKQYLHEGRRQGSQRR
ncbi:hypothetical protein F5Y16DRAFT_395985 [Xylariaceae sp. FL0255]|nr:hypothetical protein F5Y16DRAFT_395985 [Xylariaceae sp. FL0255]